jgi:tripartite-type tricarboxylate transporter receptor subunit TctC
MRGWLWFVRAVVAIVALTGDLTWAAERGGQYPTKPVRIVAPSGPGSAADTLARVIAPPLSERLGQPVIVDTRPGAGSILGTELVAKSPPDGYTVVIGTPALAINLSIARTMPYDALNDFAPITLGMKQLNVFAVHPSVPAKSVKELIALARARPGELPYASSGVGAISHLTIELFLLMTNTRMLHVPYKSPAGGLIDLMAGRVALMGTGAIATIPHLRSGRLRALAVTSAARTSVLPEVPTIAESGVPGYEAVGWFGVLAPTGTPKDIVLRLHKEIVAVLNQPDARERLNADGADVVAGTPEQFAEYMKAEAVKWAKVVKAAGIKLE